MMTLEQQAEALKQAIEAFSAYLEASGRRTPPSGPDDTYRRQQAHKSAVKRHLSSIRALASAAISGLD
jgi:hypothetical protein